MQVRWNYKLQPNKGQQALMSEWLVTLRKHPNYCLAERGSTRLIMPNYQQDAKVTKPFFQNSRNFGSQIRNALRLLIDY